MFRKKIGLWALLALTVLSISGLWVPAGSASSSGLASVPAASPAEGVGPDQFPEGVNPLTGLPVQNPETLDLPPALISITNFPVSARPQAGLSWAAYVFELYIGNGMTRYLGLFYGGYPTGVSQGSTAGQDASIGPIRSGRLPYESLRKLYNGFLVMAGAYSEVGEQLRGATSVFGPNGSNVNSALIDVTKLEKIAAAKQKPGTLNLSGNRFESAAPAGGQAASKAQVFYNFYNQSLWEYDAASGAYLRSQDKADGSGKFYPATDRLNGQQLAFENVVVLFAEHIARSPTMIDLDLLYRKTPALLFRDGQAYRIYASAENGDYEKTTQRLRPLRFVDAQGRPFPMKPGQTWVEIVTSNTTTQQTRPGEWNIRFYAP